VPTKYWRTPTAEFRARNVSAVIWANQVLRASISAMQATAKQIRADESLLNAEPQVAPLHEVFRLQGDEELEAAEKRYLPARASSLAAIVLAAGQGADFAGLTATLPKAMLKVQGRPILARLLEDFAHFGARAATVVRGYRADAIDVAGARFVDNPDFMTTGEAYSLALAEDDLAAGTLVAFGDIVVKRHIVQALLEEATSGITIAVDSALAGADVPDRVVGDRADTGRFSFEGVSLTAIGDAISPRDSHGAWIGLLHVGAEGAAWLRAAIAAARADGTLPRASIAELLTRVRAAGHAIRVVYNRGGWTNVNGVVDLIDASGI
jgi:phosphoenolpyruvate phosphomutase